MQWMAPVGAWAMLGLALILFLYLLKQRMEPVKVSSTFLWRKAIAAQEASRPIQKLKRSLLFLLQMLLALLLALILLRPLTVGGMAGDVLLLFDLSASMQADDGQGSRLSQAVRDAQRRLDGMPEGTRISILTAGTQVLQPLSRSSDRVAWQRALAQIAAENGGADLDGALSLALALQKELPDLSIVAYTDQPVVQTGILQPSVGKGVDNRALLSLQASGTAAVARIANYGAAGEWTLECTADGTLCDLRRVSLLEGETGSVYFDIPGGAQAVTVRIAEEDALMADNVRHWAFHEAGQTDVVLAGRDNVFLEKALALRQDVTVLKTTAREAAEVAQGALTVIDGPLPDTLPEKGALLLVDPDREMFGIQPGERIDTPTSLRAAPNALADVINELLTINDIQVSAYRPLSGEGTVIWTADGQPVLMIAENNGRRAAMLGFDLHDANLPLLKEFPIFLQRLLGYLVPEPLEEGVDAKCGDTIAIRPRTFAKAAFVDTPGGRRIPIDPLGETLYDTQAIGLYTLTQTDEAGDSVSTRFALHIPGGESDVRTEPEEKQADAKGVGAAYGREWTTLLIGLALLLLLTEWGVYCRGY